MTLVFLYTNYINIIQNYTYTILYNRLFKDIFNNYFIKTSIIISDIVIMGKNIVDC